jgi:hypothetical protein
MRSTDLNRQQLTAMEKAIEPSLKYLNKLLTRMQQRYYPDDDPLWKSVLEARSALQKMVSELRSCRAELPKSASPATRENRSGYRLGRPRRESH